MKIANYCYECVCRESLFNVKQREERQTENRGEKERKGNTNTASVSIIVQVHLQEYMQNAKAPRAPSLEDLST